MIGIQLVLYCVVLTLAVRISVVGGAINALYFYPKAYQDIACARGIADPLSIAKKRKRFMIPFVSVMFITLLLIIGLWNHVCDFKTAYIQSLLFLEVMTWYDGIVIDRLWVGHSRFWIIPGMEDQPYVQSWKAVLKKRSILTLIWIVLAAVPACIIYLVALI